MVSGLNSNGDLNLEEWREEIERWAAGVQVDARDECEDLIEQVETLELRSLGRGSYE